MANEIKLSDAKCQELSLVAPVTLAKEDNKKGSDFEIEAYTGAVVDRWWGRLAIDVDGISSKKNMPIFRDHIQNQIVGYSNDTRKEGSFFVSGKFVASTEHSKEVKDLAKEGFPWQASIGVKPKKVLSVEPGQKHKVNGADLEGPAEVWIESEVLEVSFVPLGADSNTGATVFSIKEVDKPAGSPAQTKENSTMGNQNQAPEITTDSLKTDHPEIYRKVIILGAESERKRIQDVLAMSMPGHEKLVNELAFDGLTTGPQAAVKILQAERARLETMSADLNSDGQKPVTQPANVPDTKPAAAKTPKEQWDADAGLREEFADDFAAYEAYCNAAKSGAVKSISKK
ncbi:MAG: hypothetical protein ACU83N_10060 [Gammaproteobacteria bacterium]